jgi:hypothetical protein
MSVAEVFGPKSSIIADLRIAPTAAYLLAAPSVPEAARQEAIEKAEAGQTVTVATAKDILKQARRKGKRKPKSLPADRLGARLVKVLERYRQRWKAAELSGLVRQLREFADMLERPERGRRRQRG